MSAEQVGIWVLAAPSLTTLVTYYYLLWFRGGHQVEAAEQAAWVFFYSLAWAILAALIYASFLVLPGALG